MLSSETNYRVLTTYAEVRPLLPKVVQAADSDKDALGFFPEQVFHDFARKDQLFVVVVGQAQDQVYAGHLLFDVRFPKAHVRQVFVDEAFRRLKLGGVLLDELKEQLTRLQFISIHARVAEDLRVANAFWERQDFYPQRLEAGGATRNRTIVVRAHELTTPQLFQSSGISAADPLGLDFKRDVAKPLFLLDLNVLFDLGPRRPRHEQAVSVFRAERMGTCALAISSEIEVELKRTAHAGKTDPMQALASVLPSFPTPAEDDWSRLAPALAKLVFPVRASQDSLTNNDLSDLKHLATAIHHGLPGLVTSDASVLACAKELRRHYGIEVISPESFQIRQSDHQFHGFHGATSEDVLTLDPVSQHHEQQIQRLLGDLGVDVAAQSAEWAAVDGGRGGAARLVAQTNSELIGYLSWRRALGSGALTAYIAADEGKACAQDAVRSLLNHLMDQISPDEIARINLHCPPRQVVVREVAATLGYTRGASKSNELQKVVVKRLVVSENWQNTKDLLSSSCEVLLPSAVPAFRHADQQIAVVRPDGERALVTLFALETFLAPALFCLPGRGGTLVPVQRQFAEHLLHHLPQGSLLPQARAQLLQERHYLSGPSTLKAFSRGELIFFYESAKGKGACAVVAVGRILRSYQRGHLSLSAEDLTPSVLDSEQLDAIGKAKVKTVTVFDNLLLLPRAVPRDELRALGCGEAHQLLTSRRISPLQVQGILQKGLQ